MKHKDKLPGGKADKKNPKDFDKDALAEGTKHEMEHTKDKAIAQEIAMDHLSEDTQYYQKLKQVEKSASDSDLKKSGRAERIKNLVRKLKREKKKVLGQVSIPGVTKPQKRAKGEVKEDKQKKHEGASKPRKAKKPVLVGKKGGQYILTSGGKKKYAADAKKSLEVFIENENEVQQFVKNFRSKKNG